MLLSVMTGAYAVVPTGYYDSADGASGSALKTCMYNIIKGHNLSVVLGQETYNRATNNLVSDIQAFPVEYTSETAWNNPTDGNNRYGDKFFMDMDDRMISFFGRFIVIDLFSLSMLYCTFDKSIPTLIVPL